SSAVRRRFSSRPPLDEWKRGSAGESSSSRGQEVIRMIALERMVPVLTGSRTEVADALFTGRTVLVIAPHADEETFGCGGTMARAKALGASVFVMVVSVADLVHYSQDHPLVSGGRRASEFHQAMEVLGVDGTDILYHDERVHMRVDALP